VPRQGHSRCNRRNPIGVLLRNRSVSQHSRQAKDVRQKANVSWIEPVLEFPLEALEHLFFHALNVCEPAPTSQVTVLGKSLDLDEELFHQGQLVGVFLPQMVFAKVRSLSLAVFGSETHRRWASPLN